jgi:hypothetical protein
LILIFVISKIVLIGVQLLFPGDVSVNSESIADYVEYSTFADKQENIDNFKLNNTKDIDEINKKGERFWGNLTKQCFNFKLKNNNRIYTFTTWDYYQKLKGDDKLGEYETLIIIDPDLYMRVGEKITDDSYVEMWLPVYPDQYNKKKDYIYLKQLTIDDEIFIQYNQNSSITSGIIIIFITIIIIIIFYLKFKLSKNRK